MNKLFRSPWLWTLIVLTVLMGHPMTRRIVLLILPLGSGLDDLLFLVLLVMLLVYLGWNTTVIPLWNHIRLQVAKQYHARLLMERTRQLVDYVLVWIGEAHESSMFYELDPSPAGFAEYTRIRAIIDEAAATLALIRERGPTLYARNLQELKKIYAAVAGNPPSQTTWFELADIYYSIGENDQRPKNSEAELIRYDRWKLQGDWRLSELCDASINPMPGIIQPIVVRARAYKERTVSL